MTEQKKEQPDNTVDNKFIMQLKNKKFIKGNGLLDLFHKNGGTAIKTEIVRDDPLIFRATAFGTVGTFTGHGDANKDNVNDFVRPHIIRMAETRAVNRALRLYNNVGMVSAEEMGGDETSSKSAQAQSFGKDVIVPNKCAACQTGISDKEKDFSIRTFNVALCMTCQKKKKSNSSPEENKGVGQSQT